MIADGLKLDLGVAMMAGLAASILPAWLVLYLARSSMKNTICQCAKHRELPPAS